MGRGTAYCSRPTASTRIDVYPHYFTRGYRHATEHADQFPSYIYTLVSCCVDNYNEHEIKL